MISSDFKPVCFVNSSFSRFFSCHYTDCENGTDYLHLTWVGSVHSIELNQINAPDQTNEIQHS